MENIKEQFFFFDNKLKRRLVLYIAASAALICVAVFCVVVREISTSLDTTLVELQRVEMNLFRMRDATVHMKREMEKMERIITADYFNRSSEAQILSGLDAVQRRDSSSDLTVTAFVYGDAEISLPVTIKGYMGDYGGFVNDVGKLQTMKFPFFFIRSVALRKEIVESGGEGEKRPEGSGQRVSYEIRGDLRLPRSMQTVQGSANAASSTGGPSEGDMQ